MDVCVCMDVSMYVRGAVGERERGGRQGGGEVPERAGERERESG